MHQIIESLNWRYATKKFDAEKKIDNQTLEILKESVRLTATSYGLQPFKVMVLDNDALKSKLVEHSFGQSQVQDCSHLFVFCHYKELTEKHIDDYLQLVSTTRSIEMDQLQMFTKVVKGDMLKRSEEEIHQWAAKQTYIALGHLLLAAAELRIDCCPMEGFNPIEYDKILGLENQNYKSVVLAPLGYRSKDDVTQNLSKVRKTSEDFFL